MSLRGLLHEDNGRYEYGAADHQSAGAEAARQGDQHREFVSWTNYAASLAKAGRPHAALRVFRQIHQRVRDQDDQGHLSAALNNLGQACLEVGELQEAARRYAEALELQGRAMTTSAMTSLFGLGDVARERAGGGSVFYRMAFATGMAAGDQVSAVAVYATRVVGEQASPEDERLLRDMLAAPGAAQRWVVRLQVSLALAAYLERHGDPAEAVELLRGVVAEADRRGAFIDGVRARVRLARLLPRDEALLVLRTARASLLNHLTRSPDQRRSGEIAAEFIDVHEQLIDLLVGHAAPSREDVAEAFDLHEEARARSFLAGLADLPGLAPASVPADLARREAELLAERRDLRRDLPALQGGALRTRLARLDAVAEQLAAVHRAMTPFAPEHARMRQSLPVTLAEVRELLARHAPEGGVTVVSYFCGRKTTTCFTLSSADGEPRVHRAPVGEAEFTAVVEGLARTFNGAPRAFPPLGPIHPRRPHRRSLRDLDALGPRLLPADLGGTPLLCVVPHGPLHLLPVHALPDATGVRLVERSAVVHAPSLSLLAHALSRPPHRPRRALVAAVAAREDTRPEVFEDDARILREAGWAVTDLSGAAATKPAVLAELARHDLVHLTCHGYLHPHDHLESGLVLADDGDRPSKFTDDLGLRQRRRAVLRAADVAQHREPVRLVTLRACASGRLAPEHAGDEFSGLSRALLGAGAAATLTALWNVDQHSSGELLRETYRGWQSGLPLWRALWLAQRAFLTDETRPWLAHPYHWAPLVLTGDWR
ncbi:MULTISPECIES: CHAT domain-containing protein [Saccharothrix]|uniref:CHAT domain-containing protein n=1 Tax=Saccharothrix TaxID=2071 RepID=UPI00093AC61A|nr:CHAT domain-containing tetratricopeptide repeat protein [Saccharothrix sp. CB00851]OKI24986.1 hypothetical protein A6A25_33915 [Saccharothrix sp. CB00851]